MSGPLNFARMSASEAQALNRLARAGSAISLTALRSDGQAPLLTLSTGMPGSDPVAIADALRLSIEWSGALFELDIPSQAVETWTSERLGCAIAELPDAWHQAAVAQSAQWICDALDALGRGKSTCRLVDMRAPAQSKLPHVIIVSVLWPDTGAVLRGLLRTDGLGLLLCASLVPEQDRPVPAPLETDALPVTLRLCVGETDLPLAQLQRLGPGDVVLIGHDFTDNQTCLVLRTPASRRHDWSLAARVDGMQLHITETAKMMSTAPETPPAAATDEPVSIDEMPVRLSFDVGDKTISLSELQSLQAGSVLQLDRPVNDYVTLRANGAAIGTGHLIEIDGRIGVSIATLRRTPASSD